MSNENLIEECENHLADDDEEDENLLSEEAIDNDDRGFDLFDNYGNDYSGTCSKSAQPQINNVSLSELFALIKRLKESDIKLCSEAEVAEKLYNRLDSLSDEDISPRGIRLEVQEFISDIKSFINECYFVAGSKYSKHQRKERLVELEREFFTRKKKLS